MSEQPDTAAIRASLPTTDGPSTKRTRALCDALDAARVERDFHAQACCHCVLPEYGEWIARAEAAEARITAALALLATGSGDPIEAVRQALAGDTK